MTCLPLFSYKLTGGPTKNKLHPLPPPHKEHLRNKISQTVFIFWQWIRPRRLLQKIIAGGNIRKLIFLFRYQSVKRGIMSCEPLCKTMILHALIFTLMVLYWVKFQKSGSIFKFHTLLHFFFIPQVFEAVLFMVWISFGVGMSFSASTICKQITGEKLTNAWETYLTFYILACGVFFQTSFHLMFWEQLLLNIKKRASLAYKLYRTFPPRVLLVISFYQLFAQFRIRFGKELEYDEENLVTMRFLLAACFVGYALGRKARFDYRFDQANSGVAFVSPGIFKYCAMFSIFYVRH